MEPSTKDDKLFWDNSCWCTGTVTQLTIEDREVYKSHISLENIEGLKQWVTDFQINIDNPDYDWLSWKKRGLELAKMVAELLPDTASLYFLYDNENVLEKATRYPSRELKPNELQLCCEGNPIRIK